MGLTPLNRSPARNLSYYYKPHTSKTKLPIVFLHGIGIGLFPYVPFLQDLARRRKKDDDYDDEGDVGVLAVEIMPMSMRICHAALTSEEFCRQMELILLKHGITKFVLVAHSYGTILSTYLLHSSHISHMIDSVTLIDPVAILLHLPNIAYNFVYRTPTLPNEWIIWYFTSQDMGISHTLSRHFFWTENILWKEEIFSSSSNSNDHNSNNPTTSNVQVGIRKAAVILSEKDVVLDSRVWWEYLTGTKLLLGDAWEEGEEMASEGTVVWKDPLHPERKNEVIFFKGLDHAECFDNKVTREVVVRTIREMV